jgi:hypothetical protein
VEVRILWAPSYVSDEALIHFLEQLSGGHAVRFERRVMNFDMATFKKCEVQATIHGRHAVHGRKAAASFTCERAPPSMLNVRGSGKFRHCFLAF